MTKSTDASLLKRNTRESEAQRLVGAFLQQFALTEAALDEVVMAALGLTEQQSQILSANLPFAKKVHTAAAALDFTSIGQASAERHRTRVNDLSNMNGDRIVIAHCQFKPGNPGPSVVFTRVKAEGRLITPYTEWTHDDFRAKFSRLQSAEQSLRDIRNHVVDENVRARLMAAITSSPSGGLSELGFLNPLSPRSPEFRGLLHPATIHGTGTQTLPPVPPWEPEESQE